VNIEELNGRVMRLEDSTSTGGSLTIEEVDGSPSSAVTKLVLPNGTLTIVAGVATYTPAAAGLSAIADLRLLANISGAAAAPIANTLSAIIDAIVGSTQGQILTRNAGTWTVLSPGALGTVLTSNGAGANLSYTPFGIVANTITDAATITPDASYGVQRLVFTSGVGATRALANPTNAAIGRRFFIWAKQDVVGSRTWTLGSKYRGLNGDTLTPVPLSATLDLFQFDYYDTDDIWLMQRFPTQLPSTWNPSDKGGADVTLTNNNKTATAAATLNAVRGTRGIVAGVGINRYAEITAGADGVHVIGISTLAASNTIYPGGGPNGWGYFGSTGHKQIAGVDSAYGATYTASDIIGVYLNGDDLRFTKNGVDQGVAVSGMTGLTLYLMWGSGSGAGSRFVTLNVGDTPFANLPAGALAWT
jgi:hypothetical protein